MPAIDALQTLQRKLIRKTLNASVFIAPVTAASVDETTLFDATTGDLKTLTTGYKDLGFLTDAGAQFTRDRNQSDVTSLQSITPTRSDTTSDTTTMQISCQETKLATIGLYLEADTATLVPGTNGVMRVNMPNLPVSRYYRALSIAVDETPQGEIAICRYMPNAKVTNFDNQTYAKGDDPILWPVTLTGYKDDTLGYANTWIFGGAGWKALVSAMS